MDQQPERSWARDLGGMLGDLEERSSRTGAAAVPLALQIEYKAVESRWSTASGILPIRPLQWGGKGWISSGVGWNDMQSSMRHAAELDSAQVAVLADLASSFVRGYGQQNPNLLSLGPSLWSLLRRMREAGIELVPGPGIGAIVVIEEPLAIEADLIADPDAPDGEGDLSVRLGLTYEGLRWPGVGREITAIGEPAHGVALLHRPDGDHGLTTGRTLVLAPLSDALPLSMQRRLNAAPVVIPAAERAEFETEYLPRLRRQLPTASSDKSFELPEITPPRLRLTVAWTGTRADTSWAWAYGTGSGATAFGIDSRDGIGSVREPEAETELLAALTLPPSADVALRDEHGALLPARSWTDGDLVRFVDQLLPSLQHAADLGEFELDESGERLDFRAALSAPEVSFEQAEGDGGDLASERDWLDLRITITVDGEPLALKDVLTALTTGSAVVFTASGRHLPSDHPGLAQLAELVADAGQLVDQPDDGLRVGRYDLALWAELEELGVVDNQVAAWARTARALRDFEGLPEAKLDGLASTPRPYQADGIRWLSYLWESGLGGILADDMGLGKTLQTLALIAHARSQGAGPFLVVAPTSVLSTWVTEAARHTPGLTARAVLASAARREESLADVYDGADIVVTSYTLFRLEADAYRELSWGGLVLDEAHTVKNHQGKTYQEVRRLDVPFRLALTGTPFENRLMELWSLLSIVAPGLYASPKRFTQQVVRPVEQQGDEKSLARFRRRIRPFLLRRTKELVAADLPPKQEQILEIALEPKHRRIYDTQLQRERQTVLGLVDDFQRNRIAIFGALTRLRQLSLDPALVDKAHEGVGSAKLDVLVEHLHELAAEGHRALVFSTFTTYLKRVEARLAEEGIETVYLDGRTRNRPAVIDSFKNGDQPAFLISLKAGGSGLTLTEADYVFVLDPWWNPAAEAQAIDRAHRIGQQRHVMAYRLVSAGTIEEKVMALKESKAELFAQVLDGDGAMATAIGAEDVRALFD